MKKKNEKICLGDKVKCKYTGYEGIAVAKTEFINGCIQFSVAQKYDKKNPGGELIQEIGIDEQSLEIINTKFRRVSKEQEIETDEMLDALEDEDDETGGPNLRIKQRGY